MWTNVLSVFAAADPVPPVADSSPIIVALISALSGVVVAAIGAVVALSRRGSDQTTSSRPAPSIDGLGRVRERIAVLENWRITVREADDIHDRRLDYAEEVLEDVCRLLGIAYDPRSRR